MNKKIYIINTSKFVCKNGSNAIHINYFLADKEDLLNLEKIKGSVLCEAFVFEKDIFKDLPVNCVVDAEFETHTTGLTSKLILKSITDDKGKVINIL